MTTKASQLQNTSETHSRRVRKMISSAKVKIRQHDEGQKELNDCSRIFRWNYFLMTALGLWPSKRSDWWFALNFGYLTYHMFLQYLDLFIFIDDLGHVIENLTESTTYTQIFVRMLMLRVYNYSLGEVIEEARKDFDTGKYNEEERKTFVAYYAKSKIFLKFLITFTALTASSYYVQPFLAQMGEIIAYSKGANASFEFILPYHFYTYYKLTAKSYFCTYASQLPFVFVSGFGQSAADCIMVTLVYHISGQMAILAMRITQLDPQSDSYSDKLKQLIEFHRKLLWMGEKIRLAFSAALLCYLISATTLLCVLGYQILLCLAVGETAVLASLFIFIALVLLVLYTVCTVGENLITESERVCNAYYDCKWYDMAKQNAKMLSFGIARSQKPMTLTAGKFSMFCLATFTNTVKASMGYLSVLRAVM